MMMMMDDTVLIPVMMDAGEESAVRSGVTSLAYKSHEKNKNSVGKYCPTAHWRRRQSRHLTLGPHSYIEV